MKVNVKRIELAFILMLSTILICQYLLDKLVNKDTETINKIWISVFYCIFFNLFYVSRIGKMDLVEGYWRPISIRDNNIPVGRRDVRSPFDLRVMFVNFFLVNAIQPKNYFGLKVILYYNGKVGNNAFPKEFFIEGVVADRCLVRREVAYNKYEIDPNYFWIHLDEYIKIGTNYITNAMLVKQTDYFEDLASGIAVDLALFRFHAPNGIVPKEFAEDDLYFLGYCLCSMRVEGQESSPKIMG